MAEGLFRKAVEEREDFKVSSAGVAAYPGSSMSHETRSILMKHNADITGFESQPVEEKLVAEATHVFAMTRSHLQALIGLFPDYEDKFYLACEFADIPGIGVGMDVPDPIGMGPAAYEEVASTLNAAIPSLIAFIDQTWQRDETA